VAAVLFGTFATQMDDIGTANSTLAWATDAGAGNTTVNFTATGNNALIAVQGGNNTGIYAYTEAGTAGGQASELSLLGVVDNQHLATTDFTVG